MPHICDFPIAFATATTEHAGGSGVQLSGGAEMEAYGDYLAAAIYQFCMSREEPSRKP